MYMVYGHIHICIYTDMPVSMYHATYKASITWWPAAWQTFKNHFTVQQCYILDISIWNGINFLLDQEQKTPTSPCSVVLNSLLPNKTLLLFCAEYSCLTALLLTKLYVRLVYKQMRFKKKNQMAFSFILNTSMRFFFQSLVHLCASRFL